MSNPSLKDQLQAVASQLSDSLGKSTKPAKKIRPVQKAKNPVEKVKKPKPKWLEYAQYGIELLKVYFPASFKSPNEVLPLKKGIKEDLLKRLSTMDAIVTDDKVCMVKSLSYYVNTAAYLKRVVEGAMRVDLDGQPAEVVTAEEAKYSLERQAAKSSANKSSVKVPAVVPAVKDATVQSP